MKASVINLFIDILLEWRGIMTRAEIDKIGPQLKKILSFTQDNDLLLEKANRSMAHPYQ